MEGSLTDHLMCCVPGMPGVWFRSDAKQLGVAIGFASLLNLAIISTFLWTDWLDPWLFYGLWIVLAVFMAVGSIYNFSRTQWWFGSIVDVEEAEERLTLAQEEYLRGNYFESEALLHRILSQGENDIEAGLLLISVHRRTHRWKSALKMLEKLQLLDGASKWRYEILREKQLIERLGESSTDEVSG